MVKRSLTLLFMAVSILGARAQDNGPENTLRSQALQAFLDKALRLNITARVLPPDEQPVWNMKSSKVTIPGRSVAVKLVGTNIQVIAVFTPYLDESGKLFLLAQGQVWLSEKLRKETTYLSSFESIPIDLGEKISFFPLGLSEKISERKSFTIQLEIEILPYKDLVEDVSE